MPPRDVQRFQTVARQIVTDIAAVRGRSYTPQTSFDLYATTGTQGDYGYARHIANPNLYKTSGFTFETGPFVGNSPDSFHPADPTLIKRDAKAAMLTLLQQSVCAIELIGMRLFEGDAEVAALRAIRDDLLATTAAGRDWIALFERAQFALLSAAVRDENLLADAGELIQAAVRLGSDKDAVFEEADSKRASVLLKKLRVKVQMPAFQSDLDAVAARIEQSSGGRTQQVIESLMRQKPGRAGRLLSQQEAPCGERQALAAGEDGFGHRAQDALGRQRQLNGRALRPAC